MRTFVVFLLFCAIPSVGQVAFFEGDLEALKEKARKEQRVYFVDMYTSWCGYCKKMDASTFQNQQLGEYVSKHFLAYKLNAEQEPGKSLSVKHGVQGFPTVLVFNHKGDLIDKIVGYKDASAFKTALQKSESQSHVRTIDESIEQRYVQFQRDDMVKLEKELFQNSMDQFSAAKQTAMDMGQQNKRFEFEELQLDEELRFGKEKAQELELYYQLGKADEQGVRKEFLTLKEKEYASKSMIRYMILYFSIDNKPDVEVLRWVNELVLNDKSLGVFELKSFVQYKYGDVKDAKETLAEIQKKADKKALSERLELLSKLVNQEG